MLGQLPWGTAAAPVADLVRLTIRSVAGAACRVLGCEEADAYFFPDRRPQPRLAMHGSPLLLVPQLPPRPPSIVR